MNQIPLLTGYWLLKGVLAVLITIPLCEFIFRIHYNKLGLQSPATGSSFHEPYYN